MAVLLWRPPTVSNELLTAMAGVSSSSMSARCCHHAGVLLVADLLEPSPSTITMNRHHEPSQ